MEEIQDRRRRRRLRQKRRRILLFAIIVFIVAFAAGTWSVWNHQYGVTKERREVSEVQSIPVITDFLPTDSKERPGTQRKVKYIVIHETGNKGKNANAASHNNYLHQMAQEQTTSWHYTVDDHEIYYHVPDNEIAFHAGDKLKEDGGNLNGIGVEMCINPENDYEKTLENAAKLTAFLLDAYDLDDDAVKKHQDFSGKNCPDGLIGTQRWDEFLTMVKKNRS